MWAAVEGAEGRFSRPPNAMEGVSWSPERELTDLDKLRLGLAHNTD